MKKDNVPDKAGGKGFSFLEIGGKSTNPVKLPIMIVKGLGAGPTLSIMAGVHPNEYSGMEAIMRLMRKLEPKELRGKVIGVPCVNMPGFQARTRLCPIDHKNIARLFPGNPDGSLSEMLASTIFKEVIAKGDYLIDLHDGGVELACHEVVMFHKTGKEKIDAVSESFARSCGLSDIVGTPIEYDKGMSICGATEQGVPAILVESRGGSGINEKSVDIHFNAILNAMKYLEMIEGMPERRVNQKIFRDIQFLYTKQSGLFYPALESGGVVSSGDTIGEIRNMFAETVETLRAPVSGKITALRLDPVVNIGDQIAEIGVA